MNVMTVSAPRAPTHTINGECFIAMRAVANILLSPNSDRKTTPNASVNGRNAAAICGGTALEITAGNDNPTPVPDAVATPAPADDDAIVEEARKEEGVESP